MIIIITQDPAVNRWAHTTGSNTRAWGRLIVISAADQAAATKLLRDVLASVGRDEPLCLVGHGNDREIGDAGSQPADWTWSVEDVARLLASQLKSGHQAPILIESCANTVANFSAGVAVQLAKLRSLAGVWLYGYNRPVDVYHTLPNPVTLDRNVELQGTEVG
ncbi:MAG: hypothetical protein ACRDT2_08240 [Natronosporangium sp.]